MATTTTYIALLRGINVGGRSKVDMKQLKALFETLGFTHVSTYINSGNVIFRSDLLPRELAQLIEQEIEKDFGFAVTVLIRSQKQIAATNKALPRSWQNNQDMKTDVLFLWNDVDSAAVMKQLKIKEGIDSVTYVPGALLWMVARKNVSRSGLTKIVGTPLHKRITVRNANTLRKLDELMKVVT